MLKKSALGWPKIAGLGIALVVAGQFSGWNFGLAAGGWLNMLVATLLMALLCGGLALCVAELSTALPSAGGVFVYAQSAFGPFVGYLVGVACALALTIGTGAAATFICAYTESIFGLGGWPVKIALFAVIIGIHMRGVGEAMGLTFIAGVIAVVALLTFGVAMAPHVELANLLTLPANVATPISLGGIFACVPFAIWLFITVEQTGSAAEEANNPGRTMPRGILAAIGTLLVTALVVLVCAPGAGGVELVGSAGDPLYAAMSSNSAFGDGLVAGQGDWLRRGVRFDRHLLLPGLRRLPATVRHGPRRPVPAVAGQDRQARHALAGAVTDWRHRPAAVCGRSGHRDARGRAAAQRLLPVHFRRVPAHQAQPTGPAAPVHPGRRQGRCLAGPGPDAGGDRRLLPARPADADRPRR